MHPPSSTLLALAIALAVATAHPPDAHPPNAHPLDANPCPAGCFCYPEASRLTVKCRGLSSPPPSLPPLTAVLVLDGLALPRLDASTLPLRRLERLEAFHCVGCHIQSVGKDAFRGLEKLKVLDLADNDIVGLTADHFIDAARLQVLDLAGNERVDCTTLATDIPKAVLNCDQMTSHDLKGRLGGPKVPSSDLKGQLVGDEADAKRSRAKREANEGVVTLPASLSTREGEVETSTLPPDVNSDCSSPAWKVVAIVFIVLFSIVFSCNVLKCCCGFCASKRHNVKRPQGTSTVYQLTTTELDDRYT